MSRQDPHILLERALDALEDITDTAEKAQAATAFLASLGEANEEVRELRREAVLELNDSGYGYAAIASLLGLSKPRAQQIVNGWRTPKRPGVIEVQARLTAGEMRASGASDEAIVYAVVQDIRDSKGGEKVSASQIARILDMPYKVVRPVVTEVDAKRRSVA